MLMPRQSPQLILITIKLNMNIFVTPGRVSITGADAAAHSGGVVKTVRW